MAEFVLLARCAERAERYDDMADFMIEKVKSGTALNGEERDLLSAAFKGALTGRRTAVNIAVYHEQQEDPRLKEIAAGYRSKVQSELKELCQKILSYLESSLIPAAVPGEPKVFFLKMAGDYYRYMAEVQQDAVAKQSITQKAQEYYQQGMSEASCSLTSTHAVRLGLALNYSVFLHQVVGQCGAAVEIANDMLVSAAQDYQVLPPEAQADCADSIDTMNLLRENLEMWRQ
jgi:hypothetical protein